MSDGARRLHESTKHGSVPAHPESLVHFQRLDPRNAPRPFKEYRGVRVVPLVRELQTSSISATAVLSGRRGPTRPLDAALLSTILFLGAGVTRVAGAPGRRIHFRAAMSAGNLHPVEVYVVVGEGGVDGIDAGVYHFESRRFTLTVLREGDHRGLLGLGAPVAIALTGIPWRTAWKYGERGWRHLYWDAGTLIANLEAAADAHGLDHSALLGFDDGEVERLLGIDGIGEMPLAIVPIGPIEREPPPGSDPGPPEGGASPVAPAPVRLPLLEEAQSDGRLAAGEVERWRKAGTGVARSAPRQAAVGWESDESIEGVILRRGSTRRMVRRSVPADHLEWPMGAATRAAGFDVLPGVTLLDHFVNVHAVDGLEPGAYRRTGSEWEPVRRPGSLREASAALTLGQPLGGESAYTVFHCAELDPILDTLGSRGYRVAQTEAGLVSGRLSLCAFALALGATGLTFLDDPVSGSFETEAAPMLVTSVGAPAGPPAPSGTPGEPVVLRR